MCRRCGGLTLDAVGADDKLAFARARRAETGYVRQLRKVARAIDDIIKGFGVDTPGFETLLSAALKRYAALIEPWAQSVGGVMVAEVAARDERAWAAISRRMSRDIRREIAAAPTGRVMQARVAEQVTLIKSLPIETAEKAQSIALEARLKGERADAIVERIQALGPMSRSRAELIARTEVGRTATALTQARAEHIGSDGYIWRTARDADVRPSHKAMEGKLVRWEEPPTLDGLTGHAGALPRCRCYPEPVLPER